MVLREWQLSRNLGRVRGSLDSLAVPPSELSTGLDSTTLGICLSLFQRAGFIVVFSI